MMCNGLQELIVFSMNTNKDQTGCLGCCRVAHHLDETHIEDTNTYKHGKNTPSSFFLTNFERCVMSYVVPGLPEARDHSCQVCGYRIPPYSKTGADAGPENVLNPQSRRYTAALAQRQVLCPEDAATRSLASSHLLLSCSHTEFGWSAFPAV